MVLLGGWAIFAWSQRDVGGVGKSSLLGVQCY